jgi:peptidoglycan hydrolase CwlO-like protein
MKIKTFAFILIALAVGLVGGYLVGSFTRSDQVPNLTDELEAKSQQIATLQTEVETLEDQVDAKNQQIATLQTEVETLEDQVDSKSSQISDLQSQVQSLNSQIASLQSDIQSLNSQINTKNQQISTLEAEVNSLGVSVEVEQVLWDAAADTATVTLRNTGGVNVTVGSISLREAFPGATWYTDTSADAKGLAIVGEAEVFVWDGADVGFDLQAATSYVVQANYGLQYIAQYEGETPAS